LQLQLIEIPMAKRSKTSVSETVLNIEAEKIIAAIPKSSYVVALDEKGKQFDTMGVTKKLQNWLENFQDVCLLIGGPDGLAPQCLQRAQLVWSLSQLTLPHHLVRVILAEQLYRGWTILNKHPYHRA
jgi:23S rRNA (pseudouridine1915-N3)-methyltransferase